MTRDDSASEAHAPGDAGRPSDVAPSAAAASDTHAPSAAAASDTHAPSAAAASDADAPRDADPRVGPRAAEIAAVIFDLDGVLVDTEPWWHAVRVAWAAGLDLAWTEDDSRACMGRNSREWSGVMRERLDVDLPSIAIEAAIVEALVARYAALEVPVMPGALAVVAAVAARVPVAIASSAHPAVISAAVEAAGLSRSFQVVLSSDDVAAGKPAPDVYLEAARRLGVEPGRCLVVEDSWNGVLAGRAAGMRVVLVPNPSVPPDPGAAEVADVVIDRLADLPLADLAGGR